MTGSALLLVLLSALLHAAWSASIKGSRDPLAFNVLQDLVRILPTIPVLYLSGIAALPDSIWLPLLGTSITHGVYFFFLSRALQKGDLTLVYPIARSTPAFLPLFAVPVLGESISFLGAFGIFIVVGGVWLVHTQGHMSWRALIGPGVGFAYLTLATTVVYTLFDKSVMVELDRAELATPIPPAIVYFFLLSTGSAACFLLLASMNLRRGALAQAFRHEWRRSIGAVVVSFASYSLILEAFRTAAASYVVAVRQLSVLFAIALGVLLLGERPGPIRMLGAAATVAGVALIALFP